MEKNNSTIERLRKPSSRILAILFLALAVFTVPKGFQSGLGEIMEELGYACLIIAGLGRIWCTLYIAGRKDRVLCVDGPYSICRNPLYLFSFIGVVGVGLGLQSPLLTALAAISYLTYYHYVMRSEEQRLAQLFQEKFEAYRQFVPRFWPNFRAYHSDQAERVLNFRIVERGLREVVWFFVMIIALDSLEVLHIGGHLALATLPF